MRSASGPYRSHPGAAESLAGCEPALCLDQHNAGILLPASLLDHRHYTKVAIIGQALPGSLWLHAPACAGQKSGAGSMRDMGGYAPKNMIHKVPMTRKGPYGMAVNSE